MQELPLYLCDRTFARRLERAEARSNAEFVEARAQAFPNSGACWIDVAGTYAMFDGIESPVTQTFGLGLFDTVGISELETLENFFQERGADVCHEVSPLAEPSLLPLLNERGYQPFELSSILFRPIQPGLLLAQASSEAIRVRLIEPGEETLWASVAARGWSDVAPQLTEFLRELAPINKHRTNTFCFLAEREGEAIAAGALCLFEEVALLAGACTVPELRNQGAQRALLQERLRYGAAKGCDIAMIGAQPGSASQRNAERQGFRVAYTRIKWRLSRRTG